MPITLGSNIASLTAQRRLAEGTSQLSKTYERLSSGLRINRASDDAAGLAISDSLRAGSRIFNQGVRNLNDGISLLNIADSAIENLTSVVVRLEELAEQAANGTYGATQRKAIDAEAQALSKEFFRISKTTSFNGQQLLSGGFDKINLQAGYGANSVLSAGVGGAIGTGEFGAASNLSTGSGASSVAVGDLNGDGNQDLVTANANDGTLTISIGSGNGSFTVARSYSIGGSPRTVQVGDFNADGVLDISATNDSTQVSVLLGTGNGTFSTVKSYDTLYPTEFVTTGDFNGDGYADIVSGASGSLPGASGFTSVLLGRADGTFGSAITSVMNTYCTSIYVDDFNRDGISDIATSNLVNTTFSISLGRGDGTFAAERSYANGALVQSVTGADYNGDGFTDIVTADRNQSSVSLYLGNGSGTFGSRISFALSAGASPRSVVAGDFNGDGLKDIASGFNSFPGGAEILIGTGSGTFNPVRSYTGNGAVMFVNSGDFDNDGVTDLAIAHYNHGTSVYIGSSRDGVSPLQAFSLKTMADARQALPMFQNKRNQLAAQRGEIGAFQSRIQVATNVLQVTSENFKAAESRIRDADIAAESADLTRLNILQQAAASVLAQANQQPALALTLLRGGV